MLSSQGFDILQEPLLHRHWSFTGLAGRKRPGGILVTGASSYIGCHLVRELLFRGRRPLHLVVRAHTTDAAVMKFRLAYATWIQEEPDLSSLHIHAGEMNRPKMGLSRPEWDQVREETGEVVHLAMTSIYHLPYTHFQETWLPDLERMINFCGDQGLPKGLHYLVPSLVHLFQSETDFSGMERNAWQSGYAAFKLVASDALRNAMDQGLPGCIYELPAVVGPAASGSCPVYYPVWQLIELFINTGYYLPFIFQIIPADVLAEVIALNLEVPGRGTGGGLLRPALSEPFDDKMFTRFAAHLLGLKNGDRESVREAYDNKLWFDYLIPGHFTDLQHRVAGFPPVFPIGFPADHLPATPLVVMSNLNRIFSPCRGAGPANRS